MSFLTLLQRLAARRQGTGACHAKPTRRRRSILPGLEVLEDRSCPSVVANYNPATLTWIVKDTDLNPNIQVLAPSPNTIEIDDLSTGIPRVVFKQANMQNLTLFAYGQADSVEINLGTNPLAGNLAVNLFGAGNTSGGGVGNLCVFDGGSVGGQLSFVNAGGTNYDYIFSGNTPVSAGTTSIVCEDNPATGVANMSNYTDISGFSTKSISFITKNASGSNSFGMDSSTDSGNFVANFGTGSNFLGIDSSTVSGNFVGNLGTGQYDANINGVFGGNFTISGQSTTVGSLVTLGDSSLTVAGTTYISLGGSAAYNSGTDTLLANAGTYLGGSANISAPLIEMQSGSVVAKTLKITDGGGGSEVLLRGRTGNVNFVGASAYDYLLLDSMAVAGNVTANVISGPARFDINGHVQRVLSLTMGNGGTDHVHVGTTAVIDKSAVINFGDNGNKSLVFEGQVGQGGPAAPVLSVSAGLAANVVVLLGFDENSNYSAMKAYGSVYVSVPSSRSEVDYGPGATITGTLYATGSGAPGSAFLLYGHRVNPAGPAMPGDVQETGFYTVG